MALRDVTVRNRVWVSPMCQYSAVGGVPNEWHLVHLGSFARGGAGLVFTEATAVVPEGRRRDRPPAPVGVRDAAGWADDDTVRLAALLGGEGVELVDTSTGGNVRTHIPVGPGYQVPFARRVRTEAGVPSGAVGMITDPKQAEDILAEGSAEVVLLARELLRDPHWPLRAAHELGETGTDLWPVQYLRASWGQ